MSTAIGLSRGQRYDAAVAEGTLLKVTEMHLGKFRFSLCDERTPVLEVRGCRVLTGYSTGHRTCEQTPLSFHDACAGIVE